MKKSCLLPALFNLSASFVAILLVFCAFCVGVAAQGRGNMLFGDFNVDTSKVSGKTPEIFHIILYLTSGNVFSRQPISNGGRYKFLNVPNGEYELAIEVENQEVSRTRFIIRELRPTDVRRDLYLEWRETFKSGGRTGATTVPAVEEYRRSAASQAKFDRALAEGKKKSYDTAIALLREIVRDDPKDFVAWTELGTVQFKKGGLDEAVQSYLRALENRPNFALALLNLGRLRLAQKNYENAIELLTRAVEAQPQSAEANHLLGESYLHVKRGSKAVGYLNEAIRLDPVGKAEVHLRLAALYNAAGMKDRAAIEYEKFVEKKPDHPDKKRFQKYISEHRK